MEVKWYDKTWVVVLLCIVFFPVGLYALWKNSSISKGWKIGVTVLIGLGVISNLGGGKEVEKFDLKKLKDTELLHIAYFSEEDIKSSLKDPDSYKNVSKEHKFLNDSVYKINIVYSGTNSFGGRIRNNYIKTGVLKFNEKDSTFTNTVKFEKSF